MDNALGIRIHNLRKEKGLTLVELGDKVGVKHSTVSRWEKGIITNIPFDTIKGIAKALECPVNYLVSGKDTVPEYVEGTAEIIDMYSRITPEQRVVVKNLLRTLVQDTNDNN